MFKRITPSLRAASTKQATTTGRTTLKPALEGDERSPRSNPPKATPPPSPTAEPSARKKSDSSNSQTKPTPVIGAKATKLAIFDQNVKAMREDRDEKNPAGRRSEEKPALPTTQKPTIPIKTGKTNNDHFLFDNHEDDLSSNEDLLNAREEKNGTRFEKKPTAPIVDANNSKVKAIIAKLPSDFDFDGWDSKSARQQQHELQKAGLNPNDQLTLLNSETSLDTLATIMDIDKNRSDYGLSKSDVNQIAEELLQISNTRIGAKNHELSLGISPTATKTLLTMLNEKEQALLSSFGYGVKEQGTLNNPIEDIGDQISNILSGDNSIPSMLHSDLDAFEVADRFFGSMVKLDSLIGDVESDNIEFRSPAEKQRYLDYLTTEYDKNSNLYRRQLASKIDEARLLQHPEMQFKQLINDLSLPQLEGLVAQIDANGVKKLSKPHNFDNLMKDLLSDQDSALNLFADETKSPIRPYVWDGMDIVNESGIQISGYFFEDGVYKSMITCPNQEPVVLEIGKKFPEEVSISATRADAWDIQSEKLFKEATSPAGILEIIYGFGTGSNHIPQLLPEPIGPSDVPGAEGILDKINWWKNTLNYTEDSIIISIFVHFPNDHISNYDHVDFYKEK